MPARTSYLGSVRTLEELGYCDLRVSFFEGCDFAGADMRGAILSSDGAIELSTSQREAVIRSDEEPDGG